MMMNHPVHSHVFFNTTKLSSLYRYLFIPYACSTSEPHNNNPFVFFLLFMTLSYFFLIVAPSSFLHILFLCSSFTSSPLLHILFLSSTFTFSSLVQLPTPSSWRLRNVADLLPCSFILIFVVTFLFCFTQMNNAKKTHWSV